MHETYFGRQPINCWQRYIFFRNEPYQAKKNLATLHGRHYGNNNAASKFSKFLEIAGDLITIKYLAEEKTQLAGILHKVAPEGYTLVPKVRKMQIYEQGGKTV